MKNRNKAPNEIIVRGIIKWKYQSKLFMNDY